MSSTQTEITHPMGGRRALPYVQKRQGLDWMPIVGSLLVMAMVTGLVLMQMVPPAVVPRTAPETVFSAERAMDHLQVIARAPHPTGSQESEQVRDYLFAELNRLGLQPEIQTSNSVYHDTGKWGIPGPKGMEIGPDTWGLAGATVHNVIARIPGTDSSGAVVLAAHYDSVPYGPGASDDGAGVAAILEAARAIQAGPASRNDIILLLTDGEEVGLMGAQAFGSNHPWMEDAALVLNLEARGSGGTVLMYETSPNNAWLIREYARAAVAPLTGSVATDVWQRMPNSSDLTIFLQDGKQGMNFAYGENWTAYHTTQDSIEDLDPRSLQHHGANVLSLAKHFASLDLTSRAAENAVFFSVLRLGIVQYPQSWALPMAIGAALVYLALLAAGLRAKRFSMKGIGLGLVAFLCAAGASALVGFLAVAVLNWAKGGELQVGMGGTYNAHFYELGLLAVYLAIAGPIYTVFQRKTSPANLSISALFFWLLLTVVSTVVLPGASYMFLWPLAAGMLALGVYAFTRRPGALMVRLVLLLPIVVGLILAGTVLYLLQLMFGVGILAAGGFLTVLILALIFPYLDFALLSRPRAWAAVPAALGGLILAATALLTQTHADQPRLNFIFYSLDADQGKAGWVAQAHMPDTTLKSLFTQTPHQGYLSEYFPTTATDQVWVQDAPVINSPAPEMQIVQDTTNGSQRTLRLNIRSSRAAYGIMAEVEAQNAIIDAALYHQRYSREAPRSSIFFKVISPAQEGVEIALTLKPGIPVTIRLADISPGLPLNADQQAAFDSGLRSGYGGGHGVDSMTLVHREYKLP